MVYNHSRYTWGRGPGTRVPAHGVEKMRWTSLARLVVLAGCQGTVRPARRPCVPDTFNTPCLAPEERGQRARSELAAPQLSPQVGPGSNGGLTFGPGY